MKELKDYSEVELKAACYDNLAQIEKCQQNIRLINDELNRRNQPNNEKTDDKPAKKEAR